MFDARRRSPSREPARKGEPRAPAVRSAASRAARTARRERARGRRPRRRSRAPGPSPADPARLADPSGTRREGRRRQAPERPHLAALLIHEDERVSRPRLAEAARLDDNPGHASGAGSPRRPQGRPSGAASGPRPDRRRRRRAAELALSSAEEPPTPKPRRARSRTSRAATGPYTKARGLRADAEQREVQATVRRFVDERILPNAVENDIDAPARHGGDRGDGRARAPRHRHPGGVRRRRDGLRLRGARLRGDRARRGRLPDAHLRPRRPQLALAPPVRERGAEAALPDAAGARREARLLRPDGAGGRLGRRRDADDRAPRRATATS